VNHDDGNAQTRMRHHIVLTGVLQGIGCRPTVYRLATSLGLGGWVLNATSAVHIEIEGTPEQCLRFTQELPENIPLPGRIDDTEIWEIPPMGQSDFRIDTSLQEKRSLTPIPPDVAVCDRCMEELFQPSNPRYLYPFTTCTLCGPRFTVVRAFPYDRERTSMADFIMCPRCRAEYENPRDRRFHSQTNSCPDCGPRVSLTDPDGVVLAGDPLVGAIRLLRQGKILAIKGIGGFHLACDALDPDAVARLRERKGRMEKPFAVMMPDMSTVRRFCKPNPQEERLLLSAVAPIVLLDVGAEPLAPNVAPFIGTVGVMLPYAPLHHVLFRHPAMSPDERPLALVMTSGNRSEEPIVRDNAEALTRLRDLVDAYLLHDREIVLRADDSIFRVIAGRATVFRRSRGLVPEAFRTAIGAAAPDVGNEQDPRIEAVSAGEAAPVVLAAGGDMKNCLAVLAGDAVVPGPHVGDLGSPVAQDYFKQSVAVLAGYLEMEPTLVALDPHPDYFSNSLARDLGLPVVEVLHHHAHAVSLLAQYRLRGPALFAVFDGTGYGADGSIWGGEFLVADLTSFRRVGHIGMFPLPGGEAAIREPVRILAALLARNGEVPEEFLPLLGPHRDRARLWLEAVRKGINAPSTSSAGRLFDAAAAAAGFLRPVTFEGQAAMWLEGIVDSTVRGSYRLSFVRDDPVVVDPASLIQQAGRDMLAGCAARTVAAKVHNTIALLVAETLAWLSRDTGITTVGLTGGCFQNRVLTERTLERLQETGLTVLLHDSVPPNDGGLAIGQAFSARARYR
jgi:hydrogenase maturation protein HypF